MILAGDAGKITDKQEVYMKEIAKSSRRMTDLVNALLNVSRIELGTLAIAPEPTQITEVMDDVLDEMKLSAKKKRIKITKQYDSQIPIINLDKKVIRVALQNLISNSIKYTSDGGKIDIIIKNQDDDVVVSVADNGLGIPKESQKQIFGKLYRADNVKITDTKGTGLGLYITKSIIEQSGGKIWFKSPTTKRKNKSGEIVDAGTTFYCNIPKSGMKLKKGSRELS